MPELDGKVAFVTGAASGLGLAILERFLAAGAQVAAADIQQEAGAALKHRFGERVRYFQCDVTDDAALSSAINDCAAHFGGLDILVNNAGGTGSFASVDEIDADAFDGSMALLLRSVVMGTRHAVPHLRARGGGAIVNMSSAGGMLPGATRFAYATAKSAMIHYTKEAALRLAGDMIRVNAVAPGFIPTPHLARAQQAAEGHQTLDDLKRRAATVQPLPRAGTVEDIAEACLFLAGETGRFITGIVLPVDGGASARSR